MSQAETTAARLSDDNLRKALKAGKSVYGESGDYFEGFVDANSSDEQSHQNVNWEVAKNGSPIKRGHADNVRADKSQVEQALP